MHLIFRVRHSRHDRVPLRILLRWACSFVDMADIPTDSVESETRDKNGAGHGGTMRGEGKRFKGRKDSTVEDAVFKASAF